MKLVLKFIKHYLIFLIITTVFLTCTDDPISISRKWEFKTAGNPGTPAIGNDGTIYVTSRDSIFYSMLYAIDPYGKKKWEFKIDRDVYLRSPSIGDDGTIYLGTNDSVLYAINPDGIKKWEFRDGGKYYTSPAIGTGGTVYTCSDDNKKLYALNSYGEKKWEFEADRSLWHCPVIDNSGIIYIGVFTLYAIKPDGTLKWSYELSGDWTYISAEPSIGLDGTVYIGTEEVDRKLYAINPEGTLKWQYQIAMYWVSSTAIIGYGSNLYVGTAEGILKALNSDGISIWSFGTGGIAGGTIVGKNGDLFVASGRCVGSTGEKHIHKSYIQYNSRDTVIPGELELYIVNPDGTEKWRLREEYENENISGGPAIGNDGTLYIGVTSEKLIAINTDCGGVANSPWPMSMHDARHTGRQSY